LHGVSAAAAGYDLVGRGRDAVEGLQSEAIRNTFTRRGHFAF
jgi:hypothetical protein